MPQMEGAMHAEHSSCDCSHHAWMRRGTSHFGRKVMMTLMGILLAYSIVFVGTLIRNNLQKFYFIGHADRPERTIRIEAQGKVTTKPDIAVTTMGMIADAPTVAEAQAKNTDVMNKLITGLKNLGVDEKDIQTTNYNIYPQYTYKNGGERNLDGYEVSQTVTVKIRDLTKSNKVLALAGEVGANNVSGLNFTVDDPEVYKAQARDIALQKVAARAKALQQALGVQFSGVYSYDENDGTGGPIMYAMSDKVGMGGGGGAPDIQTGSQDVSLTVGVTFSLQ